ncbi:hypothetical protein [Herbaspirillum sp. 3R-11]|uniref:hypothetical protein n=1 Tax=Herbaspirillum sp. 3R-11 TaxID=2559616 RepID=UPI00143058B4|nr:hypothetical protein [Herbaspirillum sp. 3R-11]
MKFLQRVAPFQAGEVAGFSDEDADRLVANKAAELHTPSKRNKRANAAGSDGGGKDGAGGEGGGEGGQGDGGQGGEGGEGAQ